LASSLAEPYATGTPLPPTGPPRFIMAGRSPIAHYEGRAKEPSGHTLVRPAVHDAATGKLIAEVPLPPGVTTSWQYVAAARDNRTFAVSTLTRPGGKVRYIVVRLDDHGRAAKTLLVPGDVDHAYKVALSADGSRLAFANFDRVSIVDVVTGQRRDWNSSSNMISGLAWSPDGRRLAFAASRHGLGVLDPARPETDLIAASTIVKPHDGMPHLSSVAYSADGRSLIYSQGHEIATIPAGGGGQSRTLVRLKLPGGGMLQRFALEGTGRYALATHGPWLIRVDLEKGTARTLRDPGDFGQPAW
ncbi:PD40 domain-containing protein, partial [Spongiactinospora gelatinilytica]